MVLVGISLRNSPRGRTEAPVKIQRDAIFAFYSIVTASTAAASITEGARGGARGNRPDVPANFLRRRRRIRAQTDEGDGPRRRGAVKSRLRGGGIFRVTKLDWQFIGDIRLRGRSAASCTVRPTKIHFPSPAYAIRAATGRRILLHIVSVCQARVPFLSPAVSHARACHVANRLVQARHESEVFR